MTMLLLVAALMFCWSTQADKIYSTSQTQYKVSNNLSRGYIPPPPAGDQTSEPTGPPPTESPAAEQPQGPLVLMPGQCSFGANSSLSQRTPIFADAGRLYVDVGRPASCTGKVIRWEMCYMVQELGTSTVSLVVLRYNVRLRGYHIEDVYNVEVGQFSGDPETSESVCDFIDSNESIFLRQGDLIGFVCTGNIRIAFGALPSGMSGTLKVYNITIQNSRQRLGSRNQGSENLLGVDSVGQNQLTTVEQNVTPLLRIVMNKTDDNIIISSTTVPIPTVSPSPCTPDDDDNDIEFPLFTSLLTTAGVILLILVILVCLLTYCLLRQKKRKKCSKYLCCMSSCCCKRRNTATHRITVQPITDQSMMYNEVYATDDPRHIITQGRKVSTEICNNPAYAVSDPSSDLSNPYTGPGLHRATPSQDAISTATALTDVSSYPRQSDQAESYAGGLDHTYEMIETLRQASTPAH